MAAVLSCCLNGLEVPRCRAGIWALGVLGKAVTAAIILLSVATQNEASISMWVQEGWAAVTEAATILLLLETQMACSAAKGLACGPSGDVA